MHIASYQPYTTDLAYLHYCKRAAAGNYDKSCLSDRARVTAFATTIAAIGAFRSLARIVNLVNEFAKTAFYTAAFMATNKSYANASRLKDHVKLLLLNTAALVAQPLQCIIYCIAIGVGIIHPKAAYTLMHLASGPLSFITAQEKNIWDNYQAPESYKNLLDTCKSSLMKMFEDRSWAAQMAATTLVYEFDEALSSALVAPLGFVEPFRLFGANPGQVTNTQKEQIPILLLNANYSHQATFLPLLHALEQSGNTRPVYTINLPPNSEYDTDRVKAKVEQIKKQYGRVLDSAFKVDLIGHSMGSGAIQWLSKEKLKFSINKAITLGAPLTVASKEDFGQAFDITGKNDLIIPRKSSLDNDHSKEIHTGHLGLLFHKESLQAIQQYLNSVHCTECLLRDPST